ncbi:hypothetical protein WJX73_008118 [Symbiochloris irregularis]|uniref:PRKR-interacting protein 1 n=1 Tax=Symbiochloris irregularis TaxID=706552 RepID=A0AAW1PMH0_9CHLO
MSLQPYASAETALAVTTSAPEVSEEERQKRIKDAEELQAKLTYISEKVPTRIMNTAGSNAGAGSGEFHMYRMARRREMLRLARIDEAAAQAETEAQFRDKKARLLSEDEERTARRREKRQKKRKKHTADLDAGSAGLEHARSKSAGSDTDPESHQPALD